MTMGILEYLTPPGLLHLAETQVKLAQLTSGHGLFRSPASWWQTHAATDIGREKSKEEDTSWIICCCFIVELFRVGDTYVSM